jgi:iron complex outermembrane receptor protein
MKNTNDILLKFKPLATLLVSLAMAPVSAPAAEVQSEEIVVKGTVNATQGSIESKRVKSSDTATMLEDTAGVNVQTGGGVSNLPVINGLADDRLLIYVDNMIVCSACGNHMNPPLSYMPSSSVGNIYVNTGVSPVSKGGDSIGGMIQVESQPPLYAVDDKIRAEGVVSSYYRSNNHATGASFGGTVASRNLSLGVTAAIDHADDYRDGNGNKITSTYYESRNFGLTLGARSENHQVTLKAGHQYIPGQGFVNQWMDMLVNNSSFVNLGYHGSFDWGAIDATGYWQNTWHKMDSGDDKLPINLAPPVSMPYMPMITRGVSVGYTLKTGINLSDDDILRVGNEFHRFSLNDYWPPVEGYPSMWPETFLNINHGHRDRYAIFAEWEGKVSTDMTAILGVRNEQVRMDTGDVQGYSGATMYSTPAAAFNAENHAKSDSNWDFTALLKYEPDAISTYELGYSRKTRSPNLYERYAWCTTWMASGMLGWFGDGNGYVGNLNLRPEIAHTISVSGTWRDAERNAWQLKITPYFTHVHDYIDVKKIGEKTFPAPGNEVRNILQFTNINAELYGINVSGSVALWNSEGFGNGRLNGTLGYVHGIDIANGDSLYHMMPFNARLSLEQKLSGFTNTFEMELVSTKSKTDPLRFEPRTPGYVLVNIGTAYEYKNLRVDVGVTNLFDRFYYLPLGGINYDDFLASKKSTAFEPLAGMGRSFNVAFTQKF